MNLMFQALIDLEQYGDVSYNRKNEPSLSRKPLKYYSITPRGDETLHTLREQWLIYQAEFRFILDRIQNNTEEQLKNKGIVSGFQSNEANVMIVLQVLCNGPTFPYQIAVFLSRFQTTALKSFDPNEMMRVLFLEGYVEPVSKIGLTAIDGRNKRRKYWKITSEGRTYLHTLKENWDKER